MYLSHLFRRRNFLLKAAIMVAALLLLLAAIYKGGLNWWFFGFYYGLLGIIYFLLPYWSGRTVSQALASGIFWPIAMWSE